MYVHVFWCLNVKMLNVNMIIHDHELKNLPPINT